jgi:hypothetical protein
MKTRTRGEAKAIPAIVCIAREIGDTSSLVVLVAAVIVLI